MTPRHCKTCTCVGPSVIANPTIAAAGGPNITIVDVTAAAAPLVLPTVPLPGAAGAVPPLTFDRITVRS